MIYQATQTNATVTPRKLRLVAYAIKQEKPQVALQQLTFLNKEAARVLAKVLKQVLANAKNNAQVNPDTLQIKEIVINKGRVLKRGLASARGRSKPFKHQQSHITVKLETSALLAPANLSRSSAEGKALAKSEEMGLKPKKAVTKKVIKKSKNI